MSNFSRDLELREAEYNIENFVTMGNDMLKGISNLNLYEMKLLRFMIMQIKPTDGDFELVRINVKDFGKELNINNHNLYRTLDDITDHLMSEFIKIGDGNPKHKWKKFHWVEVCEYEDGVLTVKMSNELKPYLLGLKGWYTQYRLEEIVKLRTAYSIRMYELIMMALKSAPVYADHSQEVYIPVEVIKKATNTEEKYSQIGIFKRRIVEASVKEINTNSPYHIEVRDYKEGRKLVGFYFLVRSQIGYLRSLEGSKYGLRG